MRFIIGPMWLFCGIMCLTKMEKQYVTDRKKGIVLGAFFIIFGIIGILGGVLKNDLLTFTAIVLAISLLCIGIPLNLLLLIKSCHIQVWAVYVSCNRYSGGKGQSSYAPVFCYNYQGEFYKRQTPEAFSRKKIEEKFQMGQRYEIYINSKTPELCISQRKISLGNWIIGVLGIGFLLFYIFILV